MGSKVLENNNTQTQNVSDTITTKSDSCAAVWGLECNKMHTLKDVNNCHVAYILTVHCVAYSS